jgi:hypothetical protein
MGASCTTFTGDDVPANPVPLSDAGPGDGAAADGATDGGDGAPWCDTQAGATLCYDFDRGEALANVDSENVSMGVDDAASQSPPSSFWAKGIDPTGEPSSGWVKSVVPRKVDTLDLALSVRIDDVGPGANPQLEIARINFGSEQQVELVYGKNEQVLIHERRGCPDDAGNLHYRAGTPSPAFVLGQWRRIRVAIRPKPEGLQTHLADVFVGEQQIIKAFPLCRPVSATPETMLLRFGMDVENQNPVGAWAVRIDDVVLFAP